MANVLSETVGAILTLLGWDGTGFRALLLDADGRLQVDVVDWVPALHGDTHEDGGADEISVEGLAGDLADAQDAKAHLLGSATHTADTLANLNTKISDANVDDDGDPRDPNAHAASHQNGGGDDINVGGLAGDLADAQDAKAHLLGSATHTQDTLANLNLKISDADVDDDGDPRDPNAHEASHRNGGADELLVTGLSGLLGDAQTPLGHHASHEYGGSDIVDHSGLHIAARAITFIIDGGGEPITTGQKGHLVLPAAYDMVCVFLQADQVGSIVVDVWMDTWANFPPTVADSITGTEKPTITASNKYYGNTLTDWTTLLPLNNILAFNVDSCTDIERVTVVLMVTVH